MMATMQGEWWQGEERSRGSGSIGRGEVAARGGRGGQSKPGQDKFRTWKTDKTERIRGGGQCCVYMRCAMHAARSEVIFRSGRGENARYVQAGSASEAATLPRNTLGGN